MSTKLSEAMNSLYGPEATQMMGGAKGKSKCKSRPKRRIAKTRGGSEYEDCAYPEYIENSDFQKFIHAFYLIKRVCHSYASSVYVIPESKTLDAMIKEFKDKLKNEGIKEGSAEAFQYATINDLPFKKCIFTVFADADSNHYKLDKTAPYKDFGTVKRTNLLSEQYFFKYKDDNTISICPDEKTNTGATTARLIAKCLTGIYVFQGDLPKSKLSYTKKIKTNNAAFVGGSLKANSLIKFNNLKGYLMKYGEQGAERFISSCVKANQSNIKNYAKLFSGDLLHAAFRLCFNDNISDDISEANITETRDITKKLIKMYKPSEKAVDTAKFTNIFKNIYVKNVAQSLTPKEASKDYVNELMKVYNKVGKDMLYADIATNLYRSDNYNELQDIYNLVENMDSVNEGKFGDTSSAVHFEFSDSSTNVFKTSKLCNYINQALMIAPLVGINAKSYYPQLQSIDTSAKSYNIVSQMGGYFESIYNMDYVGGDNEDGEEGEDELDEKEELKDDLELSDDEEDKKENEDDKEGDKEDKKKGSDNEDDKENKYNEDDEKEGEKKDKEQEEDINEWI